MTMFRSVALCVTGVLLCASLALGDDPARQWGPNGVGCDFLGHGGQIVLYPPNDVNRWIKLQFFKLQEVDVNGNVVAEALNFGGFGFAWASAGKSNVFGASAVEFSITEFLPIVSYAPGNHSLGNFNFFNVNFQVNSFLFLQNFTGNFAGENIIGKAGQVKWQLQLTGWKFQSQANKLHYSIQLFSSQAANNTGYKRLDHVPGTLSSFAIGFGVGNIIVPNVAQVDGQNVTITSNVAYNGGQLAITWQFPAFNSSLLYDPITAASDLVIQDSTTPSGAAGKSVSAMSLIAVVAIVMWAINRQD